MTSPQLDKPVRSFDEAVRERREKRQREGRCLDCGTLFGVDETGLCDFCRLVELYAGEGTATAEPHDD